MIFRRKDKTSFSGLDDDERTITPPRSPRKQLPLSLIQLVLALIVVVLLGLTVLIQTALWNLQQEGELDGYQFAAPPHVLSDVAWQQLLDKFQSALYDTNVKPDIWLPVVLRNNEILCRKEHAVGLKDNERFDRFIAMMYAAMTYASERHGRITEWPMTTDGGLPRRQQRSTIATSSHHQQVRLPLLPSRPSIPIVMLIGDERSCLGKLYPRFSWSTVWEKEPCHAVAIPGFNLYRLRPDTSPFKFMFHYILERRYPWASKRKQAVWRGVATGRISDGWGSLPRAQLVNYSIWYPDLFDGALVDSVGFRDWYPEEEPKLRNMSKFGDRILQQDYQKYRAVVDIDGNSWSARFGELLCMNSVIIKVYPRNKNYFFDELKPWVHYIPVKADMSDLLEAIRFAVSDEQERKVKTIIYNANEWCRRRLTKRQMAMDLFWMINGYIELLGTNATRWRQWDDLLNMYQANVTLVVIENRE